MIVVDANVIAGLILKSTKAAETEALYQRDSQWVAPGLWRDEFLNVLCTYMRVESLDFSTAQAMAEAAQELMGPERHGLTSETVLRTSAESGCSGYDAQYVALARQLGLPLYTFDRKLIKACPDVAREPS